MSDMFAEGQEAAATRISSEGGTAADRQTHRGCLYHLLATAAARQPAAVAIAAPERRPLTYGQLQAQLEAVGRSLRALTVGRRDRVALVLPNGPEMAVAFLGVAASAACAPLNPAYRTAEFEFYLTDLDARALVVQADMDTPARAVARAHGIPIVELLPEPDAEAGRFTLRDATAAGTPVDLCAHPDALALLLHTSGTTTRPKLVPLTHANLRSSARHICQSLDLRPSDRCLNVMPLFHIHGLVGALLSSLAAGASIGCTPGFEAPRFFAWMEALRPTWYTAVPTMHQAVLARAPRHPEVIERCPLRLIRSCSAPLPRRVMAGLQQAFRVPVIEAYGMTEASHQMTSNPLPPAVVKPGSVGLPTGTDVAVVDATGQPLAAGETGEIVIRGPNVTTAYDHNPEANRQAFVEGWFRTGDLGHVDADGYLFLTGRLKEMINRGGEKIAPREVDDVLLEHPAVAQAVTFAMPHAQLGEEVAAAVVLHTPDAATEKTLQDFVADRLADFKIPRRIVMVEEIPRGPTGKLQRLGLAERLGLGPDDATEGPGACSYVAPQTSLEIGLAAIWEDVLGVERVGRHDNFFRLGGDSILATQVLARLRTEWRFELPLRRLFEAPTVADLALIVMESQVNAAELDQLLAEVEGLSEADPERYLEA